MSSEQFNPTKEAGMEKFNTEIESIKTDLSEIENMLNQIKHLTNVPAHYPNLSGKDQPIPPNELPAVIQFTEYGDTYEILLKKIEISLQESKSKLFDTLSFLRSVTGISTKEETQEFDPKTGRKIKDLN